MKRAIACIGNGSARVDIEVEGRLLAAAPDQYDLLLASLAACTALTLHAYAADRQWPLQSLDVYLTLEHGAGGLRITRRLFMTGIDAARQAVLLDLARLTPLTVLLEGCVVMTTSLA
jgi:putative redox protein